MAVTHTLNDGIAEVVMHHPPVNAITVADTWKIRDTFAELSRDPGLRAVILTAEGKGFNAGIDIKEMQRVDGFEHLLGSGEACYETFKQIYETPVPVIAAVNDFCMGLGIGLVGSADIIIASTKARFGLPELDNGALGCASHLARLVPPLKLRQMTLTCIPISAQELYAYGTVFKLTEPEALRSEARLLAEQIAQKPAAAVRFAKAALNHIDPQDLHGNYRLEQGYTYQLNIMGVGDQQRDAFVAKERDVTR
ncbi:MAG: enoyl-CoA hydratase family protein [Myxococcota bacterium]|nr:enoyl-CoA hydratase family protein [Myxococcota bacterium]